MDTNTITMTDAVELSSTPSSSCSQKVAGVDLAAAALRTSALSVDEYATPLSVKRPERLVGRGHDSALMTGAERTPAQGGVDSWTLDAGFDVTTAAADPQARRLV